MAWGENVYMIKCSSLLFGMLELLQQLLASNRKIKVDEDEVINNIEDGSDEITIADVLVADLNGQTSTETMIAADSETTEVITPPFKWMASGTNPLKWNLGSWG